MKTLLSIDYDFFIRENPIWDFGHNEASAIFLNAAWLARYLSINLYEETDIKRYADFLPEQIIPKLEWLGFKLNNPKITVADSHRFAFNEAKALRGCRIFNFDAHHDCFEDTPKISCANWLFRSVSSRYAAKAIWIAPSWLREFNIAFPKSLGIEATYFDYLKEKEFKGVKIDAVFVCRSGCWTPPHHDPEFLKMIEALRRIAGDFRIIENVSRRKFPTKKKALGLFEENEKMIKKLRIPKNSVAVCA